MQTCNIAICYAAGIVHCIECVMFVFFVCGAIGRLLIDNIAR